MSHMTPKMNDTPEIIRRAKTFWNPGKHVLTRSFRNHPMNLVHPEHPLVRLDGKLIYFDTGAPTSLVPDEIVALLSAHGLPVTSMSPSTQALFTSARNTLKSLIGIEMDALIGMDVIAQTGLCYDRAKGHLGWGDETTPIGAIELHSRCVMGLPVVEMEIDGQRVSAILDTGCHEVGYFLDLPKDLRAGEIIRDANPIIGEFETTSRYAAAKILAKDGSIIDLGECKFGDAPPIVAMALRVARVRGVVGSAVTARCLTIFKDSTVFVIHSSQR